MFAGLTGTVITNTRTQTLAYFLSLYPLPFTLMINLRTKQLGAVSNFQFRSEGKMKDVKTQQSPQKTPRTTAAQELRTHSSAWRVFAWHTQCPGFKSSAKPRAMVLARDPCAQEVGTRVSRSLRAATAT